MLGTEFPEVVEAVLETISATEKFSDYRIIGNKCGTTIVLRYTRSQALRQSPVWQHRSPVNLTRDQLRHNTWIKNTTLNWSMGDTNSMVEPMEHKGVHSSSTEPGQPVLPQRLHSDHHSWNIDAPEFTSQLWQGNCAKDLPKQYVDADTQTENLSQVNVNSYTQTENNVKVHSVGTQFEAVETRNVGIGCKLSPAVKSKHIQATTVMRNQSTSSAVVTNDCMTQVDKCVKIKTTECGVWLQQSPGAVGRHSQTDRKVLIHKKTNTEGTMTNSIGTQVECESEDRNNISHAVVDLGGFDGMKDVVETTSPQKGEAGELSINPTPYWAGVGSLSFLLSILEVMVSSMEQFGTRICSEDRNKKAKGIIEIGRCGLQTDYWVVFEDIAMMVNRTGRQLTTSRYVKMYGQCLALMTDGKDSLRYHLIDPHSKFYQRCEQLAVRELHVLLPRVRLKHSKSYQ
jgi:hypothetical protein